jgi:hypothetical protein
MLSLSVAVLLIRHLLWRDFFEVCRFPDPIEGGLFGTLDAKECGPALARYRLAPSKRAGGFAMQTVRQK